MAGGDWYRVENEAEIPSPALMVYPERIIRNLQRMVEIAEGPERLRPHVKTHKLPEVIGMHLSLGVNRFKCATIAEAEMVAGSGGQDILLAHQPVGPNGVRLRFLMDRYPQVRWGAIVDNADTVTMLGEIFADAPRKLAAFLDLAHVCWNKSVGWTKLCRHALPSRSEMKTKPMRNDSSRNKESMVQIAHPTPWALKAPLLPPPHRRKPWTGLCFRSFGWVEHPVQRHRASCP